MPPKKKPNEPSKKTEVKKKEKIIEDKTFGLKNKKGAKQQKFIKNVTQQVVHGNQKSSRLEAQQLADKAAKKDEKKKLQEEINALFKPVAQTVSKGVDPKSVLCAFFKQGQCSKGDKCKFSHDLTIERKGEKRNIYEDKKETMENWDEATLEDVINKKHGESDSNKLKTAIICKFFLDAVESSKYGWFWECPNGVKCIYRHCLPPGFVLKKDQKKADTEDQITIEELVETERAALGLNVTRVTLETFIKWKERKKQEKIEKHLADQEKKKADYKAGRTVGISGRQMFEFNPDLVLGDDDEAQEGEIEREVEEEEPDTNIVDISEGQWVAVEVDNTGTQASADRFQHLQDMIKNFKNTEEASKLDEAAALSTDSDSRLQEDETDAAIAAAVGATVNGNLDIDEELFDGEDIDLIEDDLETLELNEDTVDL
ncbi:zinc finger CCCH domain-containing protein 15 isoform X1 [Biomphalaria glabrata]|uniref:C3H1-type domain-containing protein n=1 Tax=Biomphalaria glabrata TaxID=6526 RepID=A0A2C9JKH9_BIOGL|nr:zinc finger CCCH domain-containing protein 15 isoform X1 [Biomphalaria glabrata]